MGEWLFWLASGAVGGLVAMFFGAIAWIFNTAKTDLKEDITDLKETDKTLDVRVNKIEQTFVTREESDARHTELLAKIDVMSEENHKNMEKLTDRIINTLEGQK